jgi:hypothetical protein
VHEEKNFCKPCGYSVTDLSVLVWVSMSEVLFKIDIHPHVSISSFADRVGTLLV